jgi:pimeloyl-ACP methyl ester carboxylesterase
MFRFLGREGYKVYFNDLPGHGSKISDWEKGSITFTKICSAVSLDIKKQIKGEKFILIAHSMGCAVASNVFLKHKSQIEKIIFINPFTPMGPFKKIDKNPELPKKGKDYYVTIVKFGKKYDLPEKEETLKKTFFGWLPQDYKFFLPLMLELAKQRRMRMINLDYREIAKYVKKIPISLITCDKDTDIPNNLTLNYFNNMYKKFSHYTLNCGHNPCKEVPNEFNSLIKTIVSKEE